MIPRLLSFVCRAMAIAQLTYFRISVPASGAPPGLVPAVIQVAFRRKTCRVRVVCHLPRTLRCWNADAARFSGR